MTNTALLDRMAPKLQARVLQTIADHYGTTVEAIRKEVLGPEAYPLYEYIPGLNPLAMVVYRLAHPEPTYTLRA